MAKRRKKDEAPVVETAASVEETAGLAPKEEEKKAPAKELSVFDCFEILGDKNRRFLLPDDTIVDFRFGVPKNAPKLYLAGFPHLGLKPGAEKFLKDATRNEILKALQGRRPEDVNILQTLLN